MKTRTTLPERVLEAATEIHLTLAEADFYAEECQVIVNDLDVIEYIGTQMLPNYFETGDCLIKEDKFESFLRGVATFAILESLKTKKVIDSIEDEDGKEVYFMPKKVKEYLATTLSTKNAA